MLNFFAFFCYLMVATVCGFVYAVYEHNKKVREIICCLESNLKKSGFFFPDHPGDNRGCGAGGGALFAILRGHMVTKVRRLDFQFLLFKKNKLLFQIQRHLQPARQVERSEGHRHHVGAGDDGQEEQVKTFLFPSF